MDDMISLASNAQHVITVANTLSPFRNSVQTTRVPGMNALGLIKKGKIAVVDESGVQYFIWTKNLPMHEDAAEVKEAVQDSQTREETVNQILSFTKPQGVFARGKEASGRAELENEVRALAQNIDLETAQGRARIAPLLYALKYVLTDHEYKEMLNSLGEISFRGKTARAHVAWVNNKEQAQKLIKGTLGQKGQEKDRLVLGFNNKEIESLKREYLSFVNEGRLVFHAGGENVQLMDLITQIPEDVRESVSINVLLLTDVDLPKAFFGMSAEEWQVLKQRYAIYLVTQALAAIPIPATHLPDLNAFRQALEAACSNFILRL
jgi:hypothetical protein